MYRICVLLVVVLVGGGCWLITPKAQPPHGESAKKASALPEALDALYPPRAKQPVYLEGMIQLDALFSGIVVDLSEDDPEGAMAALADFKKQYLELSKMVPEWREYAPIGPVEEFERAMQKADRATVMAAYGEIGKVCHSCHVATMVPVQQKYRWGSFHAITTKDPLLHETTDYVLFKRRLSANLAGIGHDLRQGQIENARRQFQQFNERFQTLKDTCSECHYAESRHFVDPESQERLDQLGAALAGQSFEPSAVAALIQGIGQESCSKCHLVHVPSALSAQAAAN